MTKRTASERDLVEERERAVAPGDVAQLADRRDVAVHRVDGLKRHQLRPVAVVPGQQVVQVRRVVVLEDPLVRPAVADALDRTIVGVDEPFAPAVGEGRTLDRVAVVLGGHKTTSCADLEAGLVLREVWCRRHGDDAGEQGGALAAGDGFRW